MCGIAGILSLSPTKDASAERLERMLASIFHRGPDEAGLHCDDQAALDAAVHKLGEHHAWEKLHQVERILGDSGRRDFQQRAAGLLHGEQRVAASQIDKVVAPADEGGFEEVRGCRHGEEKPRPEFLKLFV